MKKENEDFIYKPNKEDIEKSKKIMFERTLNAEKIPGEWEVIETANKIIGTLVIKNIFK
jgi:hypothetical protein